MYQGLSNSDLYFTFYCQSQKGQLHFFGSRQGFKRTKSNKLNVFIMPYYPAVQKCVRFMHLLCCLKEL